MIQSLYDTFKNFDPDSINQPITALRIEVPTLESELPLHRHNKGQLIVALQGEVMCKTQEELWMIPPYCSIWIPRGVFHTNRVTINGSICLLFIDQSVCGFPEQCCTLFLTPLVIEMIKHVTSCSTQLSAEETNIVKFCDVMIEQIKQMKIEKLHLPITNDPRLDIIMNALISNPADRSTLKQWAERVAMNERTLARLMIKKTSLTFGRWRQQLHLLLAVQHLSAGMSVQKVSYELGYESVSAFITMFKKFSGKSPKRYIFNK